MTLHLIDINKILCSYRHMLVHDKVDSQAFNTQYVQCTQATLNIAVQFSGIIHINRQARPMTDFHTCTQRHAKHQLNRLYCGQWRLGWTMGPVPQTS